MRPPLSMPPPNAVATSSRAGWRPKVSRSAANSAGSSSSTSASSTPTRARRRLRQRGPQKTRPPPEPEASGASAAWSLAVQRAAIAATSRGAGRPETRGCRTPRACSCQAASAASAASAAARLSTRNGLPPFPAARTIRTWRLPSGTSSGLTKVTSAISTSGVPVSRAQAARAISR